MSEFRLLVIADSHYASCGDDVVSHPKRRCDLGCELVRRAVIDADRRGAFDAIALMGDLIDNGTSPRAADDLRAVRDEILAAAPDTPLLVVPGNHDGDAEQMLGLFGQRPGLHAVGPYRFVTFVDSYVDDRICTRSEADRRFLADLAGSAGPPIVVLQHNPMNPNIATDDYPFMLTNRREVMADYAAAGVLLSISGHYHTGQALNVADGVRYFTAPAVCEAPFRYAIITLRRRDVEVEIRPLALADKPAIIDCHAHTEFAYCAEDVTAKDIIARARDFGLAGQCLTEHAGQLYCSAEDFWAARHIREPAIIWRSGKNCRMDEFRAAMLPLRDEFVRIGLEVGLDADGQLTIRDEDRDWPDLLIGAVHWIPENPDELNDAQLSAAFMRASQGLLASGVDVLAHPWRFFSRAKRPTPKELYGDLADILAATGTAAEINFHTNTPDPAFFAECIARGVKIALASDAHHTYEPGGFTAHLALLREALRLCSGQAGTDDIDDLLFYPV
ncbi:MAG: metallophosphoesterase [Planctomycetota bacterium]|nr:metallophosphoesterase [Planctomycetota bacterium]